MSSLLVSVACAAVLSASVPVAPQASPARVLASAVPRGGDELAERLVDLASPDGDTRRAAEHWLALHVEPRHAARLADALESGDAEVRRRIGRVVGAAESGLGIAADFVARSDSTLAAVGERALRAAAERWNPRAGRNGLFGWPLTRAIARKARESFPGTVRLRLDGTLGEVCSLLARRAYVPVGLVVDPAVADRVPTGEPRELVGTWDEIVLRLADVYRVGLDGHDVQEDDSGIPAAGPTAFLRFCPSTAPGVDTTGAVLAKWCRDVASERSTESSPYRFAAARALADSQWPAALDWLAERFASSGDPAALDGLLAAAGGGRIAPVLQRDDTVRALLDAAARELDANEPGRRRRGFRFVDGLSSLAAIGVGGVSFAPLVTDGWDDASTTTRWLRLVLVEAAGITAGGRAADLAARVLADERAPAHLIDQALRAWGVASLGIPTAELEPPALASPERLFELLRRERPVDLAFRLHTLGLVPPAAWDDAARFEGRSAVERFFVFAWMAESGRPDGVASQWSALLARTDLTGGRSSTWLAPRLRELRARPRGVVREAWERLRARDGADLAELDRGAVLGRIPGPARAASLGYALLERPYTIDGDLELLAAVAGCGAMVESDAARTALTGLLASGIAERASSDALARVVDACERALFELRRDELARPLVQGDVPITIAEAWILAIRKALPFSMPRIEPLDRLRVDWPPPHRARVVDLAALDRRF